MKDKKKAVLVVGGLGLVGLAAYLLTRKVEAAPPPPPPGLANLYGKVTNAQTGNPIAGVLVTLDGMSVYTDSGGNYTFLELEPGSYSGSASKAGYETKYF